MDYLELFELGHPELAEEVNLLRKGLAALDAFKAKYNLELPPIKITTMENSVIGGYYRMRVEDLKVYIKNDGSAYKILLHEAGHAIADRYLDGKMPPGEKQLSDHDYPDDVAEREAETLRVFIDNEEALQELNPTRYHYLKTFFK